VRTSPLIQLHADPEMKGSSRIGIVKVRGRTDPPREGVIMAEQDKDLVPEDVRGVAKEKIGEVTGDEELERQGRMDQAKSDLKDAGEEVTSGLGEAAEKAKDAVEGAAEKAKDAFKH